jgi:hypothetical protein
VAADPTPDHRYQTRHQRIGGRAGAIAMLGTSVVVVVQPTARTHGGYVLAVIALAAAIGGLRFSRCALHVTGDGVHVVNMLQSVDVRWEEIKAFDLSRIGACSIELLNGRWVSITGIQQQNIAGFLNWQGTRERGMIDELNALLHEHTGRAATTAPPTRQRGTQGS